VLHVCMRTCMMCITNKKGTHTCVSILHLHSLTRIQLPVVRRIRSSPLTRDRAYRPHIQHYPQPRNLCTVHVHNTFYTNYTRNSWCRSLYTGPLSQYNRTTLLIEPSTKQQLLTTKINLTHTLHSPSAPCESCGKKVQYVCHYKRYVIKSLGSTHQIDTHTHSLTPPPPPPPLLLYY
jgi:hypothetical protein